MINSNYDCVIIVHIYKEKFNYFEEKSIENLFELLGNKYDIYAICPEIMNLNYYIKKFNFKKYVPFSSIYFTHPLGYSYLMTNIKLYEYFSEYKYMLIHQPDAWIFSDNLEEWIKKDYDMIGTINYYHMFNNHKLSYYKISENFKLFNGGLSLRKISWMIDNLKNIKFTHIKHNDNNYKYNNYYFNEDNFISLEFKHNNFPSIKECYNFCITHINLLQYLFTNEYKFPFGIHPFVEIKSNSTISKNILSLCKKQNKFKNIDYEKLIQITQL